MRKVSYTAVFEPSPDGYGVYFPDLPGCISFGKTFEEAEREAGDALGLHVYGMEKDGEELPAPNPRPTLDEDATPGSLLAVITVYPDVVAGEIDNRRVKTNVTIPAWLKAEAEKTDVNYSKILEAALIDYLRTAPRTNP